MILTNREMVEKYRADKVWGAITLDALVARWARESPERTALADRDYSLTWAEVETSINAYANYFRSLGLENDDVVAVQLDNSVAMPVVFLALLRANLIVAPVPPLWRNLELTKALSQIAPKAIITKTQIGNQNCALMMRDVATEIFSVSHILAFGENIPDGVIDLNDVLNQDDDELTGEAEKRADAADHVATMCWWTDSDPVPRPVARSHNHWIAASMPTLLEAQISADDIILSAQYLSGLAGIATVLGPWLLSGAKLVLHETFDLEKFATQCVTENASVVILPSPLSEILCELFTVTQVRRAVCIWPNLDRARQARLGGLGAWEIPVVDVCMMGEAALFAVKRSTEHLLGQIPVGPITLPLPGNEKLSFLETRIKGGIQHAGAKAPILGGEILVRGPMVPGEKFGPATRRAFKAASVLTKTGVDDSGSSSDAFTSTGIHCAISGTNPPMIEPVAKDPDMATIGGLGVSLIDLDECYNNIASVHDAAAFCVNDKLLGSRVYCAFVPEPGQTLSHNDIQQRLREDGLAFYKIPEKLIEVATIPRHDDGTPDRERLLDEM